MSGFTFDAKAALRRARETQELPTYPTVPTGEPGPPHRVGRVGRVGTHRACEETEADRLALAVDLFEERAAIREHDGGQDRRAAERAALAEAARAAGVSATALARRIPSMKQDRDRWQT